MSVRPLLIAAALAALAPAANAVEIGVMGASNPDLRGTPPSAAERLLVTGDAVFQNEEVVSGPNGLGFAMFPDQTTLTIAPNSRIVLDAYVYDPSRQTGEFAITVARGALRFVGGRLTKTTDATIRTPSATIGIRGGAAAVETDESGTGRVTFIAGEYIRIDAGSGGPLYISRPGGQAVIEAGPGGASASYVGVADSETTADVARLFMSPGDGGAPAARPRGSAGGLAEANSLAPGAVDAAPVSTSGLFLEEARSVDSPLDASFVQANVQSVFFADAGFLDVMTPGTGFVNIGGDGVVQGQLLWNDSSDLDLHLILPGGAGEVSFSRRTITFNDGGAVAMLDQDNLGGIIDVPPDTRVENIIVNGDDIPAGDYLFFVDAFTIRGENGRTAFTLNTTGDGGETIDTLAGDLGPGEQTPNIPVTLEPGG